MKKTTKILWLITLLMTSAFAHANQLEKPLPADCQLESGKNYYLYMAGMEKFLYAEGLELSLSDEGSLIHFEQASNGDWTLKGPQGYLYQNIDFVGHDATDPDTYWYVEKQASGCYYLRPSKSDPILPWATYPDMWTGYSNEFAMIVPVVAASDGIIDLYPVAEEAYPTFSSKQKLYAIIVELHQYNYDVAELTAVYNTATDKATIDAAIAKVEEDLENLRFAHATEWNPYDATSRYMTNAALNPTDGKVTGWTMQSDFLWPKEYEKHSFYDDTNTLESGWNSSIGDNRLYQQLTGLRNGKYRLGNYGMWVRTDDSDGEPARGVYLYAKVADKFFKQEVSGYGWYEAQSQMEFECRSGEAEVGIMFEGSNVGYCRVFDFRLEYLGEENASSRLNKLIDQARNLLDGGGLNASYVEQLTADISQANTLIASADDEAQEAFFATFTTDYEDALHNHEAYMTLATLLDEAQSVFNLGESDALDALSDYFYENNIEDNADAFAYDNTQIDDIISTLTELIEKAAKSVIAPGSDVTDMLVNGHFDTTGGWTATLNSFSIDANKKIMEQWWGDWAAEQTLANVPNGTYRLEVQGFKWCSWDWAQSETDWLAGDGTPTYGVTSKIRLNDDETTIQNVWACGHTDITEGYQGTSYVVPDNADRALAFFALGLYNNVVETTVTDNTLKVEFDCSNSGFWNCFYNLRLTYVGPDLDAAKETLSNLAAKADEYLVLTLAGEVRKALEDAQAEATELVEDPDATFDQLNAAILKLQKLFKKATASSKDYEHLASVLKLAKDALADSDILATEAGQELQTLYQTTKADYDSDYPSLDSEAVAAVISQLEELITKAKQGAGFAAGDDITRLLANPSFETTIGQDEDMVGGAVHNLPYGWSMRVGGQECLTAQDMYDAGINSWTAIEENDYTSDGAYSYCLLSAPTPDCYLYQDIKGLPTGTYRVTVDMNVPYDGTSSRLTGQRLLVNNVVQYYGKEEQYDAAKLTELHPEETIRTFAGYEELNSNTSGEAGDMLIEHTLSVEVYIEEGESLTLGVRTDGNYDAMNIDYGEVGWDCRGRYKIDNFHLYCVSLSTTDITSVKDAVQQSNEVYNLMGIKVAAGSPRPKGLYIVGGKKVLVK